MKTREAVMVEAVRTPMGRRDGMLKEWHPVDLLAHTLAGTSIPAARKRAAVSSYNAPLGTAITR